MVGTEMLKVLEERNFPVTELVPVASARSIGKEVKFKGKSWKVVGMEEGIAAKADFALFSAGGSTSKEFAPQFVEAGSTVIDNSSAWRMDKDTPLVVPEVNLQTAFGSKLIANPNCSTIITLTAVNAIHRAVGIARMVAATYQAASGAGAAAMAELEHHSLTAQDALVAVMVAVSASDEDIRTAELVKINSAINMLPVFADFDAARLPVVSQVVFDLFELEGGLGALFGLVREARPERLFETAYALACDVAAADGTLEETELRLLEEMWYELEIDRLHAAAIERGARARHLTV